MGGGGDDLLISVPTRSRKWCKLISQGKSKAISLSQSIFKAYNVLLIMSSRTNNRISKES